MVIKKNGNVHVRILYIKLKQFSVLMLHFAFDYLVVIKCHWSCRVI